MHVSPALSMHSMSLVPAANKLAETTSMETPKSVSTKPDEKKMTAKVEIIRTYDRALFGSSAPKKICYVEV